MLVKDFLRMQAGEVAAQGALPGMEAVVRGPAPVAKPILPAMPRASLARLRAQDAVLGFSAEYRWLSNFWRARVMLDGIEYPTVEHAYQAAKAPFDGDDPKGWRHRFATPKLSPGEAKRLGRLVPMRGDWEKVKEGVMRDLVGQKFRRDPSLARRLKATGSRPIVELNAWGDRVWGMIALKDGVTLEGWNAMGRILEEVRAEL